MTAILSTIIVAVGLVVGPSAPVRISDTGIHTPEDVPGPATTAPGSVTPANKNALSTTIPSPPPIVIFVIGVSVMIGFGWIRRKSAFEDNRYRYDMPAGAGRDR